jgi:hypothetical protein
MPQKLTRALLAALLGLALAFGVSWAASATIPTTVAGDPGNGSGGGG